MTPPRIALAAIVALIFTGFAYGQGVSIAVMNPVKAFNDMQETKDLQQKLQAEKTAFDNEVKSRQQKVNDLRTQRDLLKPDSPQYADLDKQLMTSAIEADTWAKVTNAQADHTQKIQVKLLFDKIVATTSEIAQQKNLDLVVAEQKADLPENIDQVSRENLQLALRSRNIMFNKPQLDITQEVIAALDAKYKAGGGTAPAPAPAPAAGGAPAPAPAPAPAGATPAPAPAPAPAPQP